MKYIIILLLIVSCATTQQVNKTYSKVDVFTVSEVQDYYIVTESKDTLYTINHVPNHNMLKDSLYTIEYSIRYTPRGKFLQKDILNYRK